jgi:hypothetical protein
MLNFIEQQMIQHEKESYIADHIIKRLLCENCTQQEYRNILKAIEERILDKSRRPFQVLCKR